MALLKGTRRKSLVLLVCTDRTIKKSSMVYNSFLIAWLVVADCVSIIMKRMEQDVKWQGSVLEKTVISTTFRGRTPNFAGLTEFGC